MVVGTVMMGSMMYHNAFEDDHMNMAQTEGPTAGEPGTQTVLTLELGTQIWNPEIINFECSSF